ncbi:MAG: prolyl oligopeptidase family serine peptidase [Chitinophagaceae bacterium]
MKIAVLLFLMIFAAGNLKGQNKTGQANTWKEISMFFSPPKEFKNNYGAYRSPLKFYDGHTVKTTKDWNQRRTEILNQWNELMGNWPALLTDQQMKILDTVPRDGFTQYRVSFYWTPNEETYGYLLVPHGKEKKPAVITVYYEPETAIGLGDSSHPFRDFAYQLAKRGFVTLSLGTSEATKAATFSLYYPGIDNVQTEPLSMLACAAANAWYVLSKIPVVDSSRIGIMGHSFGGKWAMFASCLFDKFACAVWSDPGIVFDETRENVNYWEPWYLGYHPKPWRKRGLITEQNPAKGLYPKLVASGFDLQELHALMAPRPFLVSGGAEDTPKRWVPLNHTIAVNHLLGFENRVAMTNRPAHSPTFVSNGQAYLFFEYFLKYRQK